MNEIIKGMANASEAIQENFEELSQAKTSHDTRLTTVEQNISLLESPSYLIPCTLQNNWTQVSYNRLAYNRIAPGIPLVVLAGTVQDGISTKGTVITTLPIGYRPRSPMRVIAYRANDGSNANFVLDRDGELHFAQDHQSGVFRFSIVFYTDEEI